MPRTPYAAQSRGIFTDDSSGAEGGIDRRAVAAAGLGYYNPPPRPTGSGLMDRLQQAASGGMTAAELAARSTDLSVVTSTNHQVGRFRTRTDPSAPVVIAPVQAPVDASTSVVSSHRSTYAGPRSQNNERSVSSLNNSLQGNP